MPEIRKSINYIGDQDKYLTINPENTYFKENYNKYSNFAINLHSIYPNIDITDNYIIKPDSVINFNIDKNADLLYKIYLEIKLVGNDWDNNTKILEETIFGIIDYIEFNIDNKNINKLTGDWLYLLNTLDNENNKLCISEMSYVSSNNKKNNQYIIMLPIPFWFTKNTSLALPLWALKHEKLMINVKFKNLDKLSNNFNGLIKNIKFLGEFIELDKKEKNIYLNKDLEYLIEQVEFCGKKFIPKTINLNNCKINKNKFNITKSSLVKNIFWFIREIDTENFNNYFNFWKDFNDKNKIEHFSSASILLNGKQLNPRFSSSYYRKVQIWQSVNNTNNVSKTLVINNSNCVYLYSFGIKLNKFNSSSGFISLNKFNKVSLALDLYTHTKNRELNIYIKKYNILRIKNGHFSILNN